MKKAAKKALGAIKKIAPIAIPIALSTFGFAPLGIKSGSLMAGVLGGGLGSLAGGGSLKDAFKAAVISGGTSALLSGGKSMLGGKGFGQGVSDAFANPMGAANAPSATTQLQRLKNMELQDLLLTAPEDPTAGNQAFLKKYGDSVAGGKNIGARPTLTEQRYIDEVKSMVKPSAPNVGSNFRVNLPSTMNSQTAGSTLANERLIQQAAENARKAAPRTIFDYVTGGPTIKSGDLLNVGNVPGGSKIAEKILAPGAGINPGMLRTYGPLAAAGGLAAYAGGAFDPVPVEEVSEQDLTGYVNSDYVKGGNNPLYEANPGEYKVADINPYRYAPSSYPRVPSAMFSANKGGYMNKQPRNNELPQFAGYVRGPGTTTSDSIPGYLSDKEFVFNAESVAGADPSGRGDYNAGASNLYNLMRNLQMRA